MTCVIYYNKKTATQHLWQIFTGFFELEARGFINIKLVEKDWLPEGYTENLLIVDIDDQCRVLYDVNDGINWLWGNKEKNLEFFHETLSTQADFYFKRSYRDELLQYSKKSRVFPLGLNYPVTSPLNKMAKIHYDIKSRLRYYVQSKKMVTKLLKINSIKDFYIQRFEYIPVLSNKIPKILFITRLWEPGTIQTDKIKDARDVENNRQEIMDMNNVRIKSIIECKKLYGIQFTGGLTAGNYTAKECAKLMLPFAVSNKRNYLNLVKNSDICIATTGLNKSIGWKFGEYLAAARGVISEKMYFTLPGKFSIPDNCLEFNNGQELINNINTLIENPDQLNKMMMNNYRYYNLYLRPDNLVLNTLLIAKGIPGSQTGNFSISNILQEGKQIA